MDKQPEHIMPLQLRGTKTSSSRRGRGGFQTICSTGREERGEERRV
uniref:Uncharacterized protein n=1 Tax=Anguilla anguilla TaxID=7936 RepID=A0A0E9U0V7_ANGAN